MQTIDHSAAVPLTLTAYTDPLCVWSWAAQGPWRRLRYEFGDQLAWRNVMAGMIPSWKQFDDPLNAVSRPAQLGPLWMQARHMIGMPVEERIWVEDAPGSSYPACIAVKAAEMQEPPAGEAYLRRVREAVMLERRNIARREVLLRLADELAEQGQLDLERFQRDLDAPTTQDAFRADLTDVRYRDLGRFPALIMRRAEGAALLLVGYRPYEALCAALAHLAPNLTPSRAIEDPVSYAQHWHSITAYEVALALRCSVAEAMAGLEHGIACRQLLRKGYLYRTALPVAAPATLAMVDGGL